MQQVVHTGSYYQSHDYICLLTGVKKLPVGLLWFKKTSCEINLLFLEAGHWTDVVGLKVVNHWPQALDPFLQTNTPSYLGHAYCRINPFYTAVKDAATTRWKKQIMPFSHKCVKSHQHRGGKQPSLTPAPSMIQFLMLHTDKCTLLDVDNFDLLASPRNLEATGSVI